MLLALGAPVTLAMRTMSTVGRRRLRGVLRDPAVRGLLTRPAVLLADYNVTMAVLLLAPPYRLAERNLVVHVAVHVYLLLCGLLFWTAMLARDPVPARVARDRRLRLVALCVPLNGAVAAWVVAVPGLTIGAGRSAALTAAGVLVAASAAASLLGVAVIRGNRLVPRPAAGTVAATASV
jgi:putative copper resistance protein D